MRTWMSFHAKLSWISSSDLAENKWKMLVEEKLSEDFKNSSNSFVLQMLIFCLWSTNSGWEFLEMLRLCSGWDLNWWVRLRLSCRLKYETVKTSCPGLEWYEERAGVLFSAALSCLSSCSWLSLFWSCGPRSIDDWGLTVLFVLSSIETAPSSKRHDLWWLGIACKSDAARVELSSLQTNLLTKRHGLWWLRFTCSVSCCLLDPRLCFDWSRGICSGLAWLVPARCYVYSLWLCIKLEVRGEVHSLDAQDRGRCSKGHMKVYSWISSSLLLLQVSLLCRGK